MNASLLAVLSDAERVLIAETEPAVLAALDEDAAIECETRIRRARNKYVGQYRRTASVRVAEQRGRGQARPANKRAGMKAEVFEEALSRISRRVAVLAKASAAALRTERIEAARAARQGQRPPGATGTPRESKGRGKAARTGDSGLRSPATEKRRAHARAIGDRRQGKKDNR